MPSIEGLDPTLQAIGTLLFVAVVAVLSGWSLVFGRKPHKTETREFSVAGELADMGPVKELVEQTGLLVQQQIRTAIALEANAVAMTSIEQQVRAYIEERRQERADRDLDEEVKRRVAEEVRVAMEGEKAARRSRGG